MPVWLKGGIYASVISAILIFIAFMILSQGHICPEQSQGGCYWTTSGNFGMIMFFILNWPAYLFNSFFYVKFLYESMLGISIVSVIAWFVIGSIVGLLTNKIKSKK